MYKILAFVLALSLCGCSTTREGFRLGGGGGASESDIARVRNQVAQNAQSTLAKTAVADALVGEIKPGVIIVGETGVLRRVDAGDKKKAYPAYAEMAGKWHPGKAPYLSEAQYIELVGGWTTVEVYSVPGILALKYPVTVREEDILRINFASTLGAWIANSTTDLVVARSNDDGVMVIEKVLCKDGDKDFKACSAQYEKGRFDLNSGAELDRELKIKEGGIKISTESFKKI